MFLSTYFLLISDFNFFVTFLRNVQSISKAFLSICIWCLRCEAILWTHSSLEKYQVRVAFCENAYET